MWLEDDNVGEWWQPEGTQLITDPPYPLRADEYEDDQRDWEARVAMLAPVLEGDPL